MSIKTLVDGSDLQQAHRLTWFLETPRKGWRRFTIPLDPNTEQRRCLDTPRPT